ncbi:MAG: carbohydrate kinase family protein [Caldilineaceae bacterium]|nr:carbohydrate kinase family protein [Caldilineaceae bacterium]
MTNFDVLVIGEINADLVLTGDVMPAFGQAEKVIDDATLTIGSSGAIFACGAARLGMSVVYAGLVGDDLFGRFMVESLRARGVATDGVIIDPSQKTGLSVILSRGNDRAILTHLGSMSVLRADQVDRALVRRARHIHITSYFLQHALRPGLPALLDTARAQGITVSLDTNWDPNERWDDGLADLLPRIDVFLPNEQEARAIARSTDLNESIEKLGQIVPTVVVKQGGDGASCRSGGTTSHDPGFAIPVVDTTGAGDSFNGGFLYGYLHGWSLERSLALACACGALSIRAAGGVNAQATMAEAESLIERSGRTCISPQR